MLDAVRLCLDHAVAVGRPAHNDCYKHLVPRMQRHFVSRCRNTQLCNGRDDPGDGLKNCLLAIHNGGDGAGNKRSPYWQAVYRKCGTCERVPGGFSCRHTIPVEDDPRQKDFVSDDGLKAFRNKPAEQWQRECDYMAYGAWDADPSDSRTVIVRYYDPVVEVGPSGCEQDRNGDGVYEFYQPSAAAPNPALCTYSDCRRVP